jgi:hypothetical protein
VKQKLAQVQIKVSVALAECPIASQSDPEADRPKATRPGIRGQPGERLQATQHGRSAAFQSAPIADARHRSGRAILGQNCTAHGLLSTGPRQKRPARVVRFS